MFVSSRIHLTLSYSNSEIESIEDLISEDFLKKAAWNLVVMIFESLPECGGVFSGDACAVATIAAKIAQQYISAELKEVSAEREIIFSYDTY